jgi:pimeloyl-ACP methyl ester carboxylesterase
MSDEITGRVPTAYKRRAEMYSTERGEGPAVVFAHGTLMDRTMFEPQLAALSDAYRCIAYDLRARTDQHDTEYDLYDLADDAVALFDAKDIDSCVFVGMSMGGFTALRLADRYPDRIDGLVLIDSDALTHPESAREQYSQMVDATRDNGRPSQKLVSIIQQILFGATTNETNQALVSHWSDRWRSYPGEAVYNEVHSWLERPDFRAECADITAPVLAIHGEEDVSIEMDHARQTVEAFPNATLHPISEAGHSANLENPAAANAAIGAFLNTVY